MCQAKGGTTSANLRVSHCRFGLKQTCLVFLTHILRIAGQVKTNLTMHSTKLLSISDNVGIARGGNSPQRFKQCPWTAFGVEALPTLWLLGTWNMASATELLNLKF